MDRNNSYYGMTAQDPLSLSARRAWIEMGYPADTLIGDTVALRKESVDRNLSIGGVNNPGRVALRKESVDRNARLRRSASIWLESLSARRAWIEI